ncbi:hypothetical protein [Mycobacterium sp. TY815]|uniref:putative alpha/beta hydrolase n=1 Tax=Mycobacterium sp. TY815 TaxID=3050581 RepID=UPI0027419414|nr:hypothetical protein [Mycobacterium sp. TY815]MDP7701589.1 hypothetical protein [Mycobacterium sp. TY815]
MRLRYISVEHLIAAAGGDPWAVNTSLQRGRPAQISFLATAFHDAGRLTNEAESAFRQARDRFEAAWNRENGDHPINDAAEVQRATGSLGVQAEQLPEIAIDLERIAAILAEAQRASAGRIRALEGRLEALDRELSEAHALVNSDHLPLSHEIALDGIIVELEQRAIDDTAGALRNVEQIREMYADLLRRLKTRMRERGGYDGAVSALDGGEAKPVQSPAQAERDVHAALAGDQVAASRVNAILGSITADQLAGKVPLSPEQASVVSQLQAQQHGMSIEAVQTAVQRLGDQQEMIANSWQLMSNPALTFPRTDLKPDALQGTDIVRGGFTQLPDCVRQALEAPWSQYYDLVVGQMLAGGDPSKTVADVVKHGRSSFQTNTELDRRMLARASAMMDATFGMSSPPPQMRQGAMVFDPIVADILAAVSPDHQVVHDVLTGPAHVAFMDNVTRHFWSDHGKAAASLFDWTEHAAHGTEAGIAGETARAYAAYIGASEPGLLHLPGNHTVGEVNPDLVRGLAHGLAPYVQNISGTGGLAEFGVMQDGNRESGVMPIAKGIFAVLSTDEKASEYFNGAADREALIAEGAYARQVVNGEPGTGAYNAHLHDAMTLRGLVDSGIHSALQADTENRHLSAEAAATAEYNQRKLAYELGAKVLGAGVDRVPVVGPAAGVAIGILSTALENDYVGLPPTSSAVTDHQLPHMSIGQADREILNAVIASGRSVEGVPPQYLIEGRIGSPDELARQHIEVDLGHYDETLNQLLAGLLRQSQANGLEQPFVPDLYMVNRYDAVIQDHDPQKK